MWHEIGQESYDKLRILVYSTEDGKKLFEHKWSQSAGEDVAGERIELSDDGVTLFLHRSTGTVKFSISGGRSR
jgi:hypothetical protein